MYLRKSKYEIMHNGKIKKYPSGASKITVASRAVYKESGWEEEQPKGKEIIPKPKDKSNDPRDDSVKRAKDKIYDIVQMNPETFKYFVTLTIDPKRINSSDTETVKNIVKNFLKNQSHRNGLSYIMIPEKHKDRKKIHLHGIVNDKLTLVDSKTRKAKGFDEPVRISTLKQKGINPDECKVIYNIPQWSYGYSTAEALQGDSDYIFGYITKYITKDLNKIFGKFYWSSRDLIRNVPTELFDTNYNEVKADKEFYCKPSNTWYKFIKTDSIVSVSP